MRKVLRANSYFLLILLMEIFIPIPLVFIYKILNITDTRIMLFMNHTIIFIVPAIIYLIVTKQSAKEVLRLNKLHFKDMLLIILLAFMCQPIMMFFSLISQFLFENEIGNFITSISSTPYILLLLLVAVMPAITEEITLRGVVLAGYEEKNMYISSAIIGLFFGIFHLDAQQFLYATVLGFILALVVRITNSIFSSVIMHFLINGTSITMQKILMAFSSDEELIQQATETSIGELPADAKIIMFIFYSAIAIAFGIVVYFIIRKLKEINTLRGTLKSENNYRTMISEKKDPVFNIPFFATIIIYLVYMFLPNILMLIIK